MTRSFYLDLAKTGKRLPVATHLVLHEQPDPEAILLDGQRLADVVVSTARRFDNPLALPVMDLTLEKDIALRTLGITPDDIAKYHFDELPDPQARQLLTEMDVLTSPRIKATCEALSIIAKAHAEGATELPVGMCIGPFSLLTKLLSDPITPIFLAGSGITAEDDEEVELVYALIELSELIVAKYCQAQIEAGASAIFVCEPAANVVFFSPNQIAGGSTIYQELVIEPNLRLKKLLDDAGVDLIFHDCGDLSEAMIASFAALEPVMVSFGSPVQLWKAAPLLPKNVVIFGNLPTKKFYSDEVPLAAVPTMVAEIDEHFATLDHPYIVGSECDVLAMPGYQEIITEKVAALAQS